MNNGKKNYQWDVFNNIKVKIDLGEKISKRVLWPVGFNGKSKGNSKAFEKHTSTCIFGLFGAGLV